MDIIRRFQNFIVGILTMSKYNVGLKTLFLKGLSEPEFYGDLVYKFRKIIGKKFLSLSFQNDNCSL